jgi:cytochrome o ubiquinol oxidase subunit 2
LKKTIKIGVFVLFGLMVVAGTVLFFQNFNVAVLNPQGEIARQQRDLIVFTTLLGLVVVIPVFIMLGVFSWKYREGNTKAKYRPDWDSNKWLEMVWWGIPCVIILILGVVTWRTSHELDPYKALSSDTKPISIQVVALQWKWLFIYPELGVASTNLVQFPEKTPLNFTITSDAPMNAFWIPSLGSQVYAMSGMSSKLHLAADTTGDYKGSSSNVSGEGFADMAFTARSSTRADFDTWVENIKQSGAALDMTAYATLARPGSLKEPAYYALKDVGLYDKIVMKYMAPMPSGHENNAPTDDMPEHHDMTGHEHMNMTEMENR